MKNIYIVISQTGTFFSRSIKFITKEEFNHASISFSQDLDELYSFGRKIVNNPLIGGFVIERIGQGVFGKFPETSCAVIKVPVRDIQYKMLQKEINYFIKNRENYKYNFIGLLTMKLPFTINRKNRYFCSQWVAYILNNAHIKTKHSSEYTHPMDFLELEGAEIIYKGLLKNYKNKEDSIRKVVLNA
jgi:hypothetical protein